MNLASWTKLKTRNATEDVAEQIKRKITENKKKGICVGNLERQMYELDMKAKEFEQDCQKYNKERKTVIDEENRLVNETSKLDQTIIELQQREEIETASLQAEMKKISKEFEKQKNELEYRNKKSSLEIPELESQVQSLRIKIWNTRTHFDPTITELQEELQKAESKLY